jgi:hypothetical protein
VRNRAQCRETASSQPRSIERILPRCSTPWKQPLAGLATSIRISLRAGRSYYVGRPPRQGCRPTRTPEACCDRAFLVSSSPSSLQPPASSLSAVSFDKAKSFRVDGARTHPRAREWNSLLLVARKAPARVVGNGLMNVAWATPLSTRTRGVSCA